MKLSNMLLYITPQVLKIIINYHQNKINCVYPTRCDSQLEEFPLKEALLYVA